MTYGFGMLIDILKKNPKTIVLTEGTDARILEAASRLLASNFLPPILIGNEDVSTSEVRRLSTRPRMRIWTRW